MVLLIIYGIIITINLRYLLPMLLESLPMYSAVMIPLWGPLVIISLGDFLLWKNSKQPSTSYFRIGKLTKKKF